MINLRKKRLMKTKNKKTMGKMKKKLMQVMKKEVKKMRRKRKEMKMIDFAYPNLKICCECDVNGKFQ